MKKWFVLFSVLAALSFDSAFAAEEPKTAEPAAPAAAAAPAATATTTTRARGFRGRSVGLRAKLRQKFGR